MAQVDQISQATGTNRRELRVLILDDGEVLGRQMALGLKLQSGVDYTFDCVPVQSAAAAFAAVQSAGRPFDAFLIDQRLDAGLDGIEVMEQLLARSPTSGAIVFTQAGDLEAARRALQAGAYRYLHKPMPQVAELALILQTLAEWRETREQRDWLRVINRIAADAQRLYTREKVQQAIVDRGCEFGFGRARLWLVDDDPQFLCSVAFAGKTDEGTGARMSIADSPYLQAVCAATEPVIFQGLQHGMTPHLQQQAERGCTMPEGEWVGLPLRVEERLLGILMLGKFQHYPTVHADRSLHEALSLFARQVAAALERADLHAAEQHKNKETATLAEIGRLISSRSALNTESLTELRARIGQLLDVRTFLIAMRNEDTDFIELLIEFQDDEPETELLPLPPGKGLIRYVIEHSETLRFADLRAIQNFVRRHKIHVVWDGDKDDEKIQSWLGVPLQVEGGAVGAIIVQSLDQNRYDEHHQASLVAVARQIAGSLYSQQLRRAVETKNRRLGIFQRAVQALMRLERPDDSLLWHTALTVITASYGLEFNAAMLFIRTHGGSRLEGRLAIGHLRRNRAERAWKRDRELGLDQFETYWQQIATTKDRLTPLGRRIKDLSIDLTTDAGVFGEVLQQKRRMRVAKNELKTRFPRVFRETVLVDRLRSIEYEVAPILAGDYPIGVVIVANPIFRRQLGRMPLNELDTWLNQVGLVYAGWRQQRAGTQLAAVSQSILAKAAERPLGETLTEASQAARVLLNADSALIIPLDQNDPRLFDRAAAGVDGFQHAVTALLPPEIDEFAQQVIRLRQPRPVPDLAQADFGDGQYTYALLEREDVQSCIIVPVHDRRTLQPSGLLFVNYRRARGFSQFEIEQAVSFVGLAGEAIYTNRVSAKQEAERRERDRELAIISQVLRGALELNIEDSKADEALAELILKAVEQLLIHTPVLVGLIRPTYAPPSSPPTGSRVSRKEYFLVEGELYAITVPDLYEGITGLVLETGTDQVVADVTTPEWRDRFADRHFKHTRSELDVLIHQNGRPLGVINVESPAVGAFQAPHHQALRRLAEIAALVLESIDMQRQLRGLAYAAEQMIAPAKLEPTLHRVLDEIRKLAPDLSAVTIWYWDETSKQIRRGPFYGVRYPDRFQDHSLKETQTILDRVLDAPGPIWAEQANADDSRIAGRFVADEEIVACAAFPLRTEAAENYLGEEDLQLDLQSEPSKIGALFLSYRHEHVFTERERVLFPMLAAIVAACIRDAMVLEKLRKDRSRLGAALQVSNAIGATLDLDQTLTAIMDTLRSLFERRSGKIQICVLTYDANEKTLRFTEASHKFFAWNYIKDHRSFPINPDSPVNGTIAARVARKALETYRAEPENVADVEHDPDFVRVNATTCSQLSIALLSPAASAQDTPRLLGVLVIESAKTDAFDRDDELLIASVGHTISMAIERVNRTRLILNQTEQLRRNDLVLERYRWAAELSHDLKNYIGNIRNRLYWLKDEPQLSADGRQLLAETEQIAEALARAANRSRYGKVETIMLDEWLVSTLKDMIRSSAASRHVSVVDEFQLNAGRTCIRAAKPNLEYNIRSLINNALDAMKSDGGDGVLRIATSRQDDLFCEISISNSGPPIDQKTRQRLFKEPVSTKGNERGNGLLDVKSYLETIKGEIRLLETHEAAATTFVIRLPIYHEPSSAEHASNGNE